MKNKYIFVPLIVMSICVIFYWFTLPQEGRQVVGWAISSVYEVPQCTTRVANRWGINDEFDSVNEYIIESLEAGMNQVEVKETLKRFGEIVIQDKHTFDSKEYLEVVLVKLCKNPFGNVLLDTHYSKDGFLMKVTDSIPQ